MADLAGQPTSSRCSSPGNNVIAIEGLNPLPTRAASSPSLSSTRRGSSRDGTGKAPSRRHPPARPTAGTPPASTTPSWPAANVLGAYGIGPWDTSIQTPARPSKVYDFGITTSGWAKITMQGTAGTQVDIRYSEKLNSDGTVRERGQRDAPD